VGVGMPPATHSTVLPAGPLRLTGGCLRAELEGKARLLAPGAVESNTRSLLHMQPLAPAAVPGGPAGRGRQRGRGGRASERCVAGGQRYGQLGARLATADFRLAILCSSGN